MTLASDGTMLLSSMEQDLQQDLMMTEQQLWTGTEQVLMDIQVLM